MSGTVNPLSKPASREIQSNKDGSPPSSQYQPPPASVPIGWSQGGPPSQQIFYQQTYPTAQPPLPYGPPYYPGNQICCCSPSDALIILGVVEIVLAIFCIGANTYKFELNKLGFIILCVLNIISSSLLFLGVRKNLKFLCWQFVTWMWTRWLIEIILNIYFSFPSARSEIKIGIVIGTILLMLLRIFESYCVYVFVNENSTNQLLHPMSLQEQQYYQGYPATAAPVYSPASFGPSGAYGSPNSNYSNNPQYGGTGSAAS